MKTGVRIAVAVGVGYLLGRTRKLRLALTLAGIGASGRLGGRPAGLVKQGTKLVGSSPELKALSETVRGRLVEAGKTAAMTAASSRIDALSDRLQERTRTLSRPPIPGRAGEEGDEEPAGERGRPARAADEPPEEEEQERRAPRRRRWPEAEADEAEQAPAERPRRRPAPPRERPVRRRRPADEESQEEQRPRRAARPAVRSPVRRTRREEPES